MTEKTITLKWLKKYCKDRINETDNLWDRGYVVALRDLLVAVKKQSEGKRNEQ